jgi:dihydrolipoamide dehydrogenase
LAGADQFDLVVIGSGPGGYVAAIRAGQLGLKTVLIEKDDKLGGTCLHVGCVPTKALLFGADVYDTVRHAKDYGIACEKVSFDWAAIQERKARVVTRHAKGIESLMKKNKVEVVQGYGRLLGGGRVSVTDAKKQERKIDAKKIVLATGSEAKMLPGMEADGKKILTNREVLDLKQPPKSMMIIGAGAVGVEFASIFHRFGTQVTVLEMLPRAVPLEDEDVSAELAKAFRRQGITLQTGAKVEKTSKTSSGVSVEFKDSNGKAQKLEAETLLVAVGRAPNTGNVGLEKTRAKLDRGFVKVNEYMETDEPGLYAVGDIVAGSPLLAHVASREGIVAVEHAAGEASEPMSYAHVPNCTYCEPEIASVGLTESQAREAGHKLKVSKIPWGAVSKATILGAREGFVKIVASEPYSEILGVHMIGPRVTETIAEAVVAMRLEGTALDLAHTIHAHPTLAEIMLEAAHGIEGAPIHI